MLNFDPEQSDSKIYNTKKTIKTLVQKNHLWLIATIISILIVISLVIFFKKPKDPGINIVYPPKSNQLTELSLNKYISNNLQNLENKTEDANGSKENIKKELTENTNKIAALKKEIETEKDNKAAALKKEIETEKDNKTAVLKKEIETEKDNKTAALKKEIETEKDNKTAALKKEIETEKDKKAAALKKEIETEKNNKTAVGAKDELWWVINAYSSTDADEAKSAFNKLKEAKLPLYSYETEIDGVIWTRVRVGFFNNQEDAVAMGQKLAEKYKLPQPWIVKPGPDELKTYKHN